MKNKKALSTVVSVVIMIALVIAAAGIVFSIVKKTAEDKLGESKSCFDVIDKISLNDDYTCYNNTSSIFVSISRKVISLDYLLISISSDSNSETFKIYNQEKNITGLTQYPGGLEGVKLPGNESGRTYIVAWNNSERAMQVEIAPNINSKQCGVVDQIIELQPCLN